ncbi:MAG: shikimate kinase [Ruminiclostridium sp.]|nr:shikimate kinase [Ruminiclostridium sp.]
MKIYLCGFMGCGKSRIGRELAKAAGMTFADLDRYIVEHENMTIPEIFERYGEPHFRELEAKYIREMPDNSVVALGGGAIINENTAKTAKQTGRVVFLDADFETCYGRIKGDSNRPLAYNNPKEKVKELFDTRRPIYSERADIVIEAAGTPEQITELIRKSI